MFPKVDAINTLIKELKKVEISYQEIETDLTTANSVYIKYIYNGFSEPFGYAEFLKGLYENAKSELDVNEFSLLDDLHIRNYVKNLKNLTNKVEELIDVQEILYAYNGDDDYNDWYHIAIDDLANRIDDLEEEMQAKIELPNIDLTIQNSRSNSLGEMHEEKIQILNKFMDDLLEKTKIYETEDVIEDVEQMQNNPQTIILLNELGIIELIKEKCKSDKNTFNCTQIGKVIELITGMKQSTARKHIDALINNQIENRNHPYKNHINKEEVDLKLSKIKIK